MTSAAGGAALALALSATPAAADTYAPGVECEPSDSGYPVTLADGTVLECQPDPEDAETWLWAVTDGPDSEEEGYDEEEDFGDEYGEDDLGNGADNGVEDETEDVLSDLTVTSTCEGMEGDFTFGTGADGYTYSVYSDDGTAVIADGTAAEPGDTDSWTAEGVEWVHIVVDHDMPGEDGWTTVHDQTHEYEAPADCDGAAVPCAELEDVECTEVELGEVIRVGSVWYLCVGFGADGNPVFERTGAPEPGEKDRGKDDESSTPSETPVEVDTTSSGTLPVTGGALAGLVAAGLAALGVGGAALHLARKRRATVATGDDE
ncbi:hypothetical protein [Nocardiopsis oceani]